MKIGDNKITILVDAHVFDGFYQGTRTYLLGLYRALAERDEFNIVMAANNLDSLKDEFGGCEGIEYVEIPRVGSLKRLAIVYPLLIRRIKPDYVHFQYVGPLYKGNAKLIITMHDILFCDFPTEFSLAYRLSRLIPFWFFSKCSDVLLTVSEYSKKRISEVFGIEESVVEVVSNSVEDDYGGSRREHVNLTDYGVSGKFILYVSRIEPRKNHEILVQAYRQMKLWDSGYSLVFVGKRAMGNSRLDEEMEMIPKEHRSKICHISSMPVDALKTLYQTCSLFIFPSKGEGFGIPVIEAAACGAPVISSRATAMGMLGLPDRNYFDPNDSGELQSKISDALMNPDAYKISDRVLNRYRWSDSAMKLSRRLHCSNSNDKIGAM